MKLQNCNSLLLRKVKTWISYDSGADQRCIFSEMTFLPQAMYDNNGHLSHKQYVLTLLDKTNMLNAKTVLTSIIVANAHDTSPPPAFADHRLYRITAGRKKKSVSRSSNEAEYRAVAEAISEIVWVQSLLQHVEIAFHFVGGLVTAALQVRQILTKDQTADTLTNALTASRFLDLCLKLNVIVPVNKSISLDVMFGGIEIVACAIEWTMAELMKCPQDLSKVQQELESLVLTYVKFAVRETLRLHPPIPLLFHETSEYAEIDGYKIMMGSRVMINKSFGCRLIFRRPPSAVISQKSSGKADLDEENEIIGEDVLGFEVGAVEDEAGEDGKIHYD
ncbi:cytochrome P450 71A14-like [Papaver somniferum]|uniref:cytochrome P450 71A14-like n=1 Tax=Papaver somniferum TaxID=3469 RepID=UPI000E7033E9|nr:cytochrome P450 71A14-like [Papaver somniferum]